VVEAKPLALKGSENENVFDFNHQSPTVEDTVAEVKPQALKGE